MSCGTLRSLRCELEPTLKLWAAPANGRSRCWLDPMHPLLEAEDDQLEDWAELGYETYGTSLTDELEDNLEGSIRGRPRLAAPPPSELCVATGPGGISVTVASDCSWEVISSEGKTLGENAPRDIPIQSACFDSRGKLALLSEHTGRLDVRAPGQYAQAYSAMSTSAACTVSSNAISVFEHHSGSGFIVLHSHPACFTSFPIEAQDEKEEEAQSLNGSSDIVEQSDCDDTSPSSLPSKRALPSALLPNKRGVALATRESHIRAHWFDHGQHKNGRSRLSSEAHAADVLCVYALEVGVIVSGGADARVLVHLLPTLELEKEFKHHNGPVRLCTASVLGRGDSKTSPSLLLCCSDDGSCSVVRRCPHSRSWSSPLILPGLNEVPLQASLNPIMGFACCRGSNSRYVVVWDALGGALDRVIQSEDDGDWLISQGVHASSSSTGALVLGGDVSFSATSTAVPPYLAVLELAFAHPWQISEQADKYVLSLLEQHGLEGTQTQMNGSEVEAVNRAELSPLKDAALALEGAGGALTLAVSAGAMGMLAHSPRTVSERGIACMSLSSRALHVHGLDHEALSSLQNFYARVHFALNERIVFPSLSYYAVFYGSALEDIASAAWTLLEYATRAKPRRPHQEDELDQEEDSNVELDRKKDMAAIADASVCLVMSNEEAGGEWKDATRQATSGLMAVAAKVPSREGVQALELLAERVSLWRSYFSKLHLVAMRAAENAGVDSQEQRLGLRSSPHEAVINLLSYVCIDNAELYLQALHDLMQQSTHESHAMPRALQAIAYGAQVRPSALLYYLLGTVEALLHACNPGLASLRKAWQPHALHVLQELSRVMPCVNLNRSCMRLAVASPERAHPAATVYDAKHGTHYRDLDVQKETSLGGVDAIGVDDSGFRVAAYSRTTATLAVWVLPGTWRDAFSLRGGPIRARHTAPVPHQEQRRVSSDEVSSGMDPRFEVEWIDQTAVAVTRDSERIVQCSIGV